MQDLNPSGGVEFLDNSMEEKFEKEQDLQKWVGDIRANAAKNAELAKEQIAQQNKLFAAMERDRRLRNQKVYKAKIAEGDLTGGQTMDSLEIKTSEDVEPPVKVPDPLPEGETTLATDDLMRMIMDLRAQLEELQADVDGVPEGYTDYPVNYATEDTCIAGSEDEDAYTRYRLDYSSGSAVQVRIGEYKVNGRDMTERGPVNITADGDSVAGFSTPWAVGSGTRTHYVYFERYNTDINIDPTLYPEDLKVVSSETDPVETFQRDLYDMIGTYQTDNDGLVVEDSITRFFIGDRDKMPVVPDGKLDPTLQYPLRTLDFREDSLGELMMWNADAATLASGTVWSGIYGIPMLDKDANNQGDLEWLSLDGEDGSQNSINIVSGKVQIYSMDQPAVTPSDDEICLRTAAGGDILFSTFSDFIGSPGGGGIIDDITSQTDLLYWKQGDTGTATCYGESIGNDLKVVVIDLDNRQLDGSGGTTLDWQSRLFLGGNWDAGAFELLADDFRLSDSGTNVWNAENLTVSASSAFSLVDSAFNEVTSSGSDLLIYGGTAGGLRLESATDINYEGNAGQTITDWTTKGGVTGTGIATYSIRAVPAGGGAPIEIEVLGRPI